MANKREKSLTRKSRLLNYLRLDFGGTIVGAILFCLSFTPSLLPHGFAVQGVAAGLSFATGYGLGVAISHKYNDAPTHTTNGELFQFFAKICGCGCV